MSNDSSKDVAVNIIGKSFFVPPKCSFLLSDLSNITPLYNFACKYTVLCYRCPVLTEHDRVNLHYIYSCTTARKGFYNLIIIDPPWENRSTIRGKKLVLILKKKIYIYIYIYIIIFQ